MPFSATGLSDLLVQPLGRLGYTQPTPVQAQAIPLVLTGTDLLARAQTGTGKTAAFGLPMLEQLLIRNRQARRPRMMRGLVLSPTRELAQQSQQALATYGAPVNASVVSIFGGMAMRPQVNALRRGVDIVVATPGRLIDHMQQRTIDLSGVEVLVLDEADRLLDMGFLPALRRLLAALPSARQTLLFSATFPTAVTKLAQDFTREPARVDVSGGETVSATVTHLIHRVNDGDKGEALAQVLAEEPAGQALVFCKTKRRTDRVGERLTRDGISAAVLHGNKSQGARNRALGDFKAGRIRILVATDIAARGLDVAHLPLVVNFDLPMVPEDYIHRVGRTGRAGRDGRAVSLVSSEDRSRLPAIQRLLPDPITEVTVTTTSRPAHAAPHRSHMAGPALAHRGGPAKRTPFRGRPHHGAAASMHRRGDRRHGDGGRRPTGAARP